MPGHRGISGAASSQGPGVYLVVGSPSALIQKGDWCGSVTTPSPSKRKPKVRVKLNTAFCDEENQRGLAMRREERAIDRGQLNGDPILEMRIIAFITVAPPVQRILNHIGEPSTPPRIAPARGPPQWEEDDSGAVFLDEQRFCGDPLAQPEPEYQFDQRVTW